MKPNLRSTAFHATFFLIAPVLALAKTPATPEKLNQIYAEYWEENLQANPLTATVHLWSEPQLELSEIFPRQDEQVHSTVLDGESVLLNLNSGRYYTLNVVGSTIWNLCRGEQSLRQIHSAICARFDVSEQQAQDDMLALIVLLEQEGLLHTERR